MNPPQPSDVELSDIADLFAEPADFYQAEKQPTFVEHKLLNGQTLRLRLVGHSPLWGNFLWNAARVTAGYLEENSEILLKDKTVLELGAGAGLPSIVAVLRGAQKVVVTDYPDPPLISNLDYNIHTNALPQNTIFVEPYLWGQSPGPLLSHLENSNSHQKFSVLILSDLVFNHSEHKKLLLSIQLTLSKSADAIALVFFTPHRPWLYQKDMAFFKVAEEGGFSVEKILEKKMDPMFEDDPGDRELRRTVYGYALKWKAPL